MAHLFPAHSKHMTTRIRTVTGAHMTVKNARRQVKRGHARWVGDRIEIIKSDHGHMPCTSPVRTAPTPEPVRPFIQPNISDSGQSVYPIIGYNRASKGAGRPSRGSELAA